MKWKRRAFRFGTLFLGFGIIVLVFVSFRSLHVKRIVGTSSSLKYGLETLHGIPTLWLDTSAISRYLKKRNPWIKALEIQVKFPDTLIISTFDRRPKANVRKGNFHAIVDAEGIIVQRAEIDETLPVVDVSDTPLYLMPPADWRIVKALALIEALNRHAFPASHITLDNAHAVYQVMVNNEITAYIPYKRDVSETAASLQEIIARFRIEGKRVRKIDLRFTRLIAEFYANL